MAQQHVDLPSPENHRRDNQKAYQAAHQAQLVRLLEARLQGEDSLK